MWRVTVWCDVETGRSSVVVGRVSVREGRMRSRERDWRGELAMVTRGS